MVTDFLVSWKFLSNLNLQLITEIVVFVSNLCDVYERHLPLNRKAASILYQQSGAVVHSVKKKFRCSAAEESKGIVWLYLVRLLSG